MFSHFVASPCLHKILLTKFSSEKMLSHFVASPCLIVLAHNEAKIVSLVPRLPLLLSSSLPLGGKGVAARRRMRGSRISDLKC